MRKKHVIETGKKYGRFTAVEPVSYTTKGGNSEKKWLCKDSEGRNHYFRARFLTTLISEEEVAEANRQKIGRLVLSNSHQMGVRRRYYAEYLGNGVKRGIEFQLSFDEFNSLIIERCHYCGKDPSSSERWSKIEHKNQPKLLYNGIDRIDSTLGYKSGNVVTCCLKCNLMKHSFNAQEFLEHVVKIYRFNRISSTTIPQGSTLQANGSGNGVPPA